MKMKKIIVLTIIAAFLLSSCNSIPELTEEERERIIQGSVFTPQNVETIKYVPYEVVKYVYPEEAKVETISVKSSNDNIVEEMIDQNSISVQTSSDFHNAIVEYSFIDGKIYDIFTSPNHVTDIRLAPGETISGDAAIGDSESWQLSTAISNENGRSVTHIYIKPATIGLETTIIIPTDQRTYYIRLISYENLYMVGVRWNYPQTMTFGTNQNQEVVNSTETQLSINVEAMNNQYDIKGDKVIWKPVSVFDDGVHTYIQFDPRFNSSSGAPALYFLPKESTSESKMEVVNYIIRGNLYITDFVLQDKEAWYLMADKKNVKITRK